MNRRLAVTALAALALAGCAASPPVVSTTPPIEEHAALLEPQARAVVDDTFAHIDAADAALDPELLSDRVAGDALTVRTAQYKVAKAVSDQTPNELPDKMQAIYVTGTESWPRVFAAVSEQPSDDLTPVVSLWTQPDVDTPYQLVNWAHMIPGATLPAMPGPANGATELGLTESGMDPSPRQVLEDYLEYLRGGTDSPLAANFAPDTYADRLFAARDVLSKAAQGAGGNYVDTIQSDIAHTHVLSTADGGALLFAPITIDSSFAVVNAKVSVAAADQPLVEGTLANKVTHHYLDMIVIYMPGPASDGLPVVVAADHHLVKVTAD